MVAKTSISREIERLEQEIKDHNRKEKLELQVNFLYELEKSIHYVCSKTIE